MYVLSEEALIDVVQDIAAGSLAIDVLIDPNLSPGGRAAHGAVGTQRLMQAAEKLRRLATSQEPALGQRLSA